MKLIINGETQVCEAVTLAELPSCSGIRGRLAGNRRQRRSRASRGPSRSPARRWWPHRNPVPDAGRL